MTHFSHTPTTASLVNLALATRGLAPESTAGAERTSDERIQSYSLALNFFALVAIAAIALSLLIVTPGLGS